MTGFADGSRTQDLALLERPASAGGRGGRRLVVVACDRRRRLFRAEAPRRRLQSRRRLRPAEAGGEDGRLADVRTRPRAHPLLPAKHLDPPSARPSGASRRASCSSSSRSSSRAASTSWTRTGLSTRSTPARATRVEAQDRHPERVVARLLATAACSPSTSSPSRRWRFARTAREQGAVAAPAARAQRVIAARPRREGDLRLRVRRHLRPRREDGQDAGPSHRGRGEGRPGVRQGHRSSPTTTRARCGRSTPRTGK